jgi:rod shape-determining protein MreB
MTYGIIKVNSITTGTQTIDIDALKTLVDASTPQTRTVTASTGVTGGGALIHGVPELLTTMLELPVNVANDPLTSVVRGTGTIVEKIEEYSDILLDEDALPTLENL